MRQYKKYEFCKAVDCEFLEDKCGVFYGCLCPYTAKQFHGWLQENGFEIVKKEVENKNA